MARAGSKTCAEVSRNGSSVSGRPFCPLMRNERERRSHEAALPHELEKELHAFQVPLSSPAVTRPVATFLPPFTPPTRCAHTKHLLRGIFRPIFKLKLAFVLHCERRPPGLNRKASHEAWFTQERQRYLIKKIQQQPRARRRAGNSWISEKSAFSLFLCQLILLFYSGCTRKNWQ